MFLNQKRTRGFITIEHAILIAFIVAALLASAVYLKRSLMGKYRSVGDGFGFGRQHQSAN